MLGEINAIGFVQLCNRQAVTKSLKCWIKVKHAVKIIEKA